MKLRNQLLKYQEEAVEKLYRLKVGALFMEQGTGKTITALELARRRYEAKKIDRVIWLCPCTAKKNIKDEIIKHCPSEFYSAFVICGIETLSTSIRANTYLLSVAQDNTCFLVVDESLLIKNPSAYRTENILRLSKQCPYRLILNGTPISRNEADLFAQFYVLDWRILGYRSYWSFAANHLEFDEYGKLRAVLDVDYLAQKIAPYSFAVKKAECVQLPEKQYDTQYFTLTDQQNEIYDQSAEYLLRGLDEYKPETIYRLFSGLQAIISGKRLVFSENGKHFRTEELFMNAEDNPRIACLLENLTEEKTIIFCRYESEINQLCNLLSGAVRFDGNVPDRKRAEALKKFQNEGKYLIANKNCAGFSLNLQFCHRIIYLSNDWELGKRIQSEDRVHRIGQDKTVQILDICAMNTIDEKILECLRKKESLLESIKNEIANMENRKKAMRRLIYGSRYKKQVFDCAELEEN